MEERIKEQVKDGNPAEIEELILDNVRESTLVGLDQGFTALATLSAINVGLTSLDGLPSLLSLTKLELGDNKLTGGLEALTRCPSLRHVSLVGNRLASVEDLTPLKSLEKLESVDLLDCPLTKLDDYRAKVFALLPDLKSLDGLDQAGEEVEESDSEVEEDGEGEEESEGEEDENEVGLDYLNKDLDDTSDDNEYDPTEEGEEEEEGDHVIPSDGEQEGDGGHVMSRDKETAGEGAPVAKKQKLDAADSNQNAVAEN